MNSFSNSNNELDYTQDTNLHPSGIDDINPFEIGVPKEETLQIRIPLGGTFSYSYYIHGSVGNWWESQYDKSAFEMTSSCRYLDPERNRLMCGADKAVKTETFIALEKGTFTIEIEHDFRGKIVYNTTIQVEVC